MGTADFLWEFIKSPTTTAAVGPSSRSLAAQMVAPIPNRGEPVVVELGPGTGAFTEVIQRRLGGRGKHLALELNSRWAAELGQRFPAVESVCADARQLPELLRQRGLRADVVVSGLPWVAHAPVDGVPLIRLIAESLTPGGAFTQFGYTWTRWAPPARRQLADLRAEFEETVISRTVWRNLPPAVVYLARRPHRAA
ncbi:methyltransferase domain-containing protein [Saccharopolyspora sp. K220]|uniref:class I SAM-dependent methyltransferase n=1 Tax=Saccharopolyspora soli TaxID=2926618 RepID=UPI001F579E6F|nr:methyltransferase domain-containing protein [Saccharopolyspora soli]MCI2417241.1 methyltransferase domain-containing protein [Saccharopolyspora soli]